MLGISKPDTTSSSTALKLIALFAALRLLVAYFFPATIDEAYAIVVSRQISLSYFDHPPLGFNIAQFMAWITGSEHIWIIRLPFIAMGSASAWMVYLITQTIYDKKAAYWALCWFLVAPYFFISAGHFVVPDGPLNLALLLSFYCLMPALRSEAGERGLRSWIGFGIFLAVALTAKYQAVLFGVSVFCFLISTHQGRNMLRTPAPWIAAAIAAVGLLPMLIWNANNEFVSLQFQSSRATNAGGPGLLNFLTILLGQMIYILPIPWLVALLMTKRSLFGNATPTENALAWIAAIPIVLFLLLSFLSTGSLPHWAMAGFLFTYPFIGKWCADNLVRFPRAMPLTLNLSALGITLVAIIVALQAQFSWIRGADLGWPLSPWAVLQDNKQFLQGEDTIYTTNWKKGAKIGHAFGPDVTIIPLEDPRHFQFNVGNKKAALVIEKISHINTENELQALLKNLERIGLTIRGEPSVIYEQSGDRKLFGIARVEVSKTPD